MEHNANNPAALDLTLTRQTNAILAAIVATSDDTIISKNLDGIILSWNPASEKMFGYSQEEALGKHISLIIPPDRIEEEDYIINEVREGRKVDHFETIRKARDGRLVHISLSVSPIVDASGRVIGASKIARDISEQVAHQAEKARHYEEVKALNARKDEFIGLASHELKTPLTSIGGYLEILSRMITEEKGQLFLQKTRQQVKKLSALVNDLLDVSKIESGKMPFSLERFDIRQVIEDVIELMSHSNHQFQFYLNTDLAELSIEGDPHRIEQVLINLMTNAVRYSPGTDRVEVFLSSEEDQVVIGVKDYGVGIPEEKLQEIFSRFYRVDETKTHASGLGLGLYLSQEIVSRHGGKIWAESQPGDGSVFWVRLPLNATFSNA